MLLISLAFKKSIVYNFSSRGEIEHKAAYAKFWRDNKECQEYYGIFEKGLLTSPI